MKYLELKQDPRENYSLSVLHANSIYDIYNWGDTQEFSQVAHVDYYCFYFSTYECYTSGDITNCTCLAKDVFIFVTEDFKVSSLCNVHF